jgi:hypothetical protein
MSSLSVVLEEEQEKRMIENDRRRERINFMVDEFSEIYSSV